MEKFSSKELVEICKEAVSEIAENGFLEKALTERQREILRKIKESHKDGIWLEKAAWKSAFFIIKSNYIRIERRFLWKF